MKLALTGRSSRQRKGATSSTTLTACAYQSCRKESERDELVMVVDQGEKCSFSREPFERPMTDMGLFRPRRFVGYRSEAN
jgi:hypothetical protein